MAGDKAVVWGRQGVLLLPSWLPSFPVGLKEGAPELQGEVGKGVALWGQWHELWSPTDAG